MDSTADTVRRVLAGQRDAYADLVRRHQDMLLAFAAFRLPDAAVVDEVVQQTFIRAYQQLRDYQPDKDFGAWLRTICRFMILAELKRATRERENRLGYQDSVRHHLLVTALEAESGPDFDALRALNHCIGLLETHARSLVRSRYQESLKVEEIAERVGQSPGWVATTLCRIRETLRKCMERQAATAS